MDLDLFSHNKKQYNETILLQFKCSYMKKDIIYTAYDKDLQKAKSLITKP